MSVPFAARGIAGRGRLLSVYFAPQRGRIMLVAALVAADIALRLVNPQIIRMFIDTAQAGGPITILTTAAILYLLVGLTGRLVNLGSAYAGLRLGWTATNRLRADLAAHLLRLDMPFHKSHTPGELIERIDGDVTTLADFFADMLLKVVGNLMLVLGILALLYRENAQIGLLLTGYTLLVILALALVGRIGARAWAAARQAWSDMMSFLEERLGATEDVRGIGAEAHHERRLGGLMLNLLRKARGGWLANALGQISVNFLFIVGYGLGLALGASLYLRGEASIGAAFMIVSYIGMLAAPLEQIREQAEQFQAAAAGSQRVEELLALAPQVTDAGRGGLDASALSVGFNHVVFQYPDGLSPEAEGAAAATAPTLDAVSFDVAPGRVLGVLGRTGSGKTTVTRLLLRLYDPQSGAIRLNGVDLRDISLDALRDAVGMVTQDVQLFAATVRENITLFDDRISDDLIEAALKELGILDWARALPQGLDTTLAPGGGMSAGEAQLLAFARILLRDPGLVILDEAASRLDPLTERRLERAIDTLLKGPASPHDNTRRRTAIIIAHRLRTAQVADDILILEGGAVEEFGPRAALAADPNSRFSQLLRAGLEEALA